FLRVLSACHNAFVRHFLRPDLHLMAVQTRNERGDIIPVIPATADADPGYHTGLSIIDVLDALKP
ncbi:MAG: N-acyl-D-glucosamine 2-epimerase, partial [Gemmatimonadetes bacterium]|nr:N-acyl-D-glucosamine 2-epimerase [Gemmatimonadota bacterium]